MSSFIISCGGTGGHLTPGISLAERLTESGHKCCLIISKRTVDGHFTEHYSGLKFFPVSGLPFSLGPIGFLSFTSSQLKAFITVYQLILKVKPKKIIAFGGFITFGVGFAGMLLGRSLVLHESNRVPGKATRLFARWASRVYLPKGVKIKDISPEKIRNIGLPLRRGISLINKRLARSKLKIQSAGKLLVVMGGSQGAQILNSWIKKSFKDFALEGINVLCLTGNGKGTFGYIDGVSRTGEKVKFYEMPFSHEIGVVLSSADLVVSRAGAGTIAELVKLLLFHG